MKLADVQQALAQADINAGQDFIYELLAAYGIPQASITRLRTGDYNRSSEDHVVIWKRRVWDIYLPEAEEEELVAAVDAAQTRPEARRVNPRFFISRSDTSIAAIDGRLGTTLNIRLADVQSHAAFFMPWTGAEKVNSEITAYIDTRVAKQMAKLYDALIAETPDLVDTDRGRAELNTFFSRLLFCFFAEDTGVFPDGIFTDAITQLTDKEGTDLADFLDKLFDVLDTPNHKRKGLPSHFADFGYVNGSLFADDLKAPKFSRKARNIVVDCGTLDWSSINPDIFGSMIQAVTAGEDRSNLGMHYTSVENILKVLNPLFLDDLEERFDNATTVKKLNALLDHLADIRVFDPACGSGNFLIIAYKRLRGLEHRITGRISELTGKPPLFADSRISLEHFYGIEIDNFAHDIAKLSLWFAKHQMNQEYDDLFGHNIPLIPLTETGSIHCDNAARADWTKVCPPTDTTYICGNPPYLGSSLLEATHKADFAHHFDGEKYSKELDYISLWFLKASVWLQGEAAAAFVSTNSICQGQHVALLWPPILDLGVEIDFAHTSFLWSNNAAGNAGVTCVVIGLSRHAGSSRKLYFGEEVREVTNINPYLIASEDNTIVHKTRTRLSVRPSMAFGNKPVDGGHLVLQPDASATLLKEAPASRRFIRPYIGADEMIKAKQRWCVWIDDDKVEEAESIQPLQDRLSKVKSFRSASKKAQTRSFAEEPHRFIERRHQDLPCIAVPAISSERRSYIPIDILGPATIASNKIYAVYGAETWLFAVLQSSMHMAWVRTVCGRLKSDYSYGNTLGYNTFPFPGLDDAAKAVLADSALRILAARERWPDRSLAELYDPDKMPANLRAAHQANDALVDSLYRKKAFGSDTDRMELLLSMYRDLVAEVDEDKASKTKKKGG